MIFAYTNNQFLLADAVIINAYRTEVRLFRFCD